jgi:hypothetical protein
VDKQFEDKAKELIAPCTILAHAAGMQMTRFCFTSGNKSSGTKQMYKAFKLDLLGML